MPIHDFIADDGETISVYVPASAPTSEHSRQTRDGKVYKRVYSVPLAATNMATRLGDATQADFSRATTGKRGMKLGDMWEISAEAADRRKERQGHDPIKEKWYDDYEKKMGEKHADIVRRERLAKAQSKLAEFGVKIRL